MRFVDLLPIIILFGAFYLLIMRPARNRQRAQQQLLSQLEIGGEVMTTSGMYGTIAGIDDDVVRLELAPGVVVRVAKAAVARTISAPGSDEPEADDTGPAALGEDRDPNGP